LETPKHPGLPYFAQFVLAGVLTVLGSQSLTGQTNGPDVVSATALTFEKVKARAETNDGEAQFVLGWMYENGEGAPRDQKHAFHWWLKAAGQGQPVAQYNVGLMYSVGQGVAQDYTEAASWWRRTTEPMDTLATYQFGWLVATGRGVPRSYKDARDWWVTAAERGYAVAKRELNFVEDFFVLTDGTTVGNVSFATNTPIGDAAYRGYRTVKHELDFQSITFKDGGRYLENVHVIAKSPVAIFYRQTNGICCGEARLANLPPDLQQMFGYDPRKAAEYEDTKAREEAAQAPWSRGRPSLLVRYLGVSKPLANTPAIRESTNIALLVEIVSDYKSKNTYIGKQTGAEEDIYVCGDMAMALWSQVTTRGFAAKIMIGDVKEEMRSIFDANHAWVLADVGLGRYLALEATGGFVSYESEAPGYYFGHAFAHPKELKDYMELLKQLREATRKHRDALESYELQPSSYAAGLADARLIDVQELRRKLIRLLIGGG